MSALDVIDLHKAHQGQPTFSGVNLAIEAGECVSLLAKPRAGKSALLRLLAGLEQANSGEICIGSKVVTDLPPQLRNVALITKNPGLYPHMSVAENLGFALHLRRHSKDRIETEVQQVAAEVGINHLLDAAPGTLLLAEQQRVALARALVRQPEVILLDDPFSGVPPDESDLLREAFRAAVLRSGATAVLATSDANAALEFGQRVAALTEGRIAQIAPPDVLRDLPVSLNVAALVSRAPLVQIHGRLSEDGARFVARDSTALPLPMAQAPDTAFGAALVYAFRAEAVRYDPSSAIRAEQQPRPQGCMSKRVTLSLAGTEFSMPWSGPEEPQGDIGIGLDLPRCHLFERETGLRL